MLQRLSSAILNQIGMVDVLEIVCREVQSLTGAAGSAVLLEEQGRLEIAFSSGDAAAWADRLLHEHATPSNQESPVEPVLINELWIGEGEPSTRVRSLLAVPLRVHGNTIGAVQLVNKPPGFDEDDLRIVSRIADQVAMTVEHTRLNAQQDKMAVLAEAIASAERRPDRVVLLGMAPSAPDVEYGWIVPAKGQGRVNEVARFVEKPDIERARALMQRGAVVNSLILVATGTALLRLFRCTVPDLSGEFASWFEPGDGARRPLGVLYRGVPAHDFSRDVLER